MQLSDLFLERLRSASRVAALSGAGMSAASGVPTFRGKDGLWNRFRPHELANREAFLRDPELVWEWYRWRRNIIYGVKPNPGHQALVEMEPLFADFAVITQNVDNLHQKAGSENVIELHGNILRDKCIDCMYYRDVSRRTAAGEPKVPNCPECGGLLRPAVVWFGEMLPLDALETARKLAAKAEIFFSVGTSSLVEPAASLPYLARAEGAFVVEINTEETPLSGFADERLAASAHEALPLVVAELKRLRK